MSMILVTFANNINVNNYDNIGKSSYIGMQGNAMCLTHVVEQLDPHTGNATSASSRECHSLAIHGFETPFETPCTCCHISGSGFHLQL